MKRLSLLLSLALLVAALVPAAEAAKKKKLVPVDQTFYIVWTGTCALSTDKKYANPDEGCADPFAGVTGDAAGLGPWAMQAIKGVPLTLDASKVIKGKISVDSWYLAGADYDVMGTGLAQIDVTLSGESGGEEVVIGELTTEPYVVTPASASYVVEFEMQPAAELTGKVFKSLTLTMEATGA